MNKSKFTCYFCNQTIENESQEGHASTCGSVLEPCVQKCGSYVPRNLKQRHLRECPNTHRRSLSHKSVSRQDLDQFEAYISTANLNQQILAKETASRKASNISQADSTRSNNDIAYRSNNDITYKIQNLEFAVNDLSNKLNRINTNQINTIETQKTAFMKNATESDKLNYQIKILRDWKNAMEINFANLQKDLKSFEYLKSNNEVTVHNMQETVKAIQMINIAINENKTEFKTEQINVREMHNDFKTKIQEIKDYFIQENAVVAALWNDQKNEIEKIISENDTFERILAEQKNIVSSLILDLRINTEISTENADKINAFKLSVDDIKNTLTQIKLDVELLEDSQSNMQAVVSNIPGRIIWKLSDFKSKMLNAKQNDSVLKGPIFYSFDYGYRVRLMVYLNGMKKWKGRHMLACLHVMKGDYDSMLKWPCKLEGNVILRDVENHDNPKDYVRYITAKREFGNDETEEPQESSTQYIFIPHTTLKKTCHLKDDSLFIEIIMIDKLANETLI